MWLIGRLAPDHKTIADFRKDNGVAIRKVCAKFVALCRQMGLLQTPSAAIGRQQVQGGEQPRRNFTHAKMARRMAQIDESVSRYLRQLDSADGQEPSEAISIKTTRMKEKIGRLADLVLGSTILDRERTFDRQSRRFPIRLLSLA